MASQERLLRSIRLWLALFILGLALSGITAFPLVHELHWLSALIHHSPLQRLPALTSWVDHVNAALSATSAQYPFLAYGTDWLAFGHLVIAIFFLGPLIDPVRNKWVVTAGLIACAGVPVLAFIAGPIRGIPLYWRLIDSSFGLLGCIPLLLCRTRIQQLEAKQPGRV